MIRHYCAYCGHHVELGYHDKLAYCPQCDKIIGVSKTIQKEIKEEEND